MTDDDPSMPRRIPHDFTSPATPPKRTPEPLTIASARPQGAPGSQPRLDVVIPAHNATAYIQAAADSALAQHGADVHVVLVDDGSDDHLDRLVASWDEPRITFLRHPEPRGVGAARNTGVTACDSQWLGFLDADDMWPHNRFLRLSAAIQDPTQEMVFGHQLTFDDGSEPDPGEDYPIEGTPVAALAGGSLLQRELFLEIGPFDEELRLGEFIDWMSRARFEGLKDRVAPTISLLRRSHATNMTRTRRDEYSAYLDVVTRARARQREARGG